MMITMRYNASPGEVFAPSAFDGQIDSAVPVTVGDHSYDGRVIAAKVSEDGSWADLTIELEGTVPGLADDLPPLSDWTVQTVGRYYLQQRQVIEDPDLIEESRAYAVGCWREDVLAEGWAPVGQKPGSAVLAPPEHRGRVNTWWAWWYVYGPVEMRVSDAAKLHERSESPNGSSVAARA